MAKTLTDENNQPDEEGSSWRLVHERAIAKAQAEALDSQKSLDIRRYVALEQNRLKVVSIDISRNDVLNPFKERRKQKQVGRTNPPLELELEFTPKRTIRKKYRKAASLPDPSQSHRAEVNLNRKQMKYRTDQERIDHLTTAAKQIGLSRDDFLDQIIDHALKKFPELTP